MVKKLPPKQSSRRSDATGQAKISKEMNLGEVAKTYPKAAEIMLAYGLHCLGCFANVFDTIDNGMKLHGYSDKDTDGMIEKINKEINLS